MKYWVYKETRILGPFDKEAVSGLPGLDSGTLVCAGDPAGDSWVPAGDVAGLTGVAAGGAGALLDDFPSSVGLLDQLQIDSAGLVDDDEFPGAFAEELFQDASLKKGFGDALSARAPSDEAEARRARDKISELTVQLEALYRYISELEAGKTDLARLLTEKDIELRSRRAVVAPPPSLPEGMSVVPVVPEAPPLVPPPSPPAPVVAAASEPAPPPLPELPAAVPLDLSVAVPELPAAAAQTPPATEPPAAAPSAPAPTEFPFGKSKSFKIVPTVKSFKVLGADEAAPSVSPNPVPEFKVEPVRELIPPAAMPPAVPVVLAPPPDPVPVPMPESVPFMNPLDLLSRPQEPSGPANLAPPAPLDLVQPVPDIASEGLLGSPDATMQVPPPVTLAQSGAANSEASAVAARFAKPEPAPATGEVKKTGRNNKAFLVGGGVLVIVLILLGLTFMRQQKDDLKQLTTLDDGKAPIGVPADDGSSATPPIVKPKIAPPPAAVAPAPPPGPSAEHLAAIALVKDFPLDGERGTVGRWLQYSYTASPDAGTEEWNASSTGDTVLVEYHLVPGAAGGKGALYLFEADLARGLVMGKNIEARQMLAGGPPPEAPRAKKKKIKKASSKRPAKRRRAVEDSKEVPFLPLPDSGELRPPAEDDGAFGPDTTNSGI